MLSDLPCRSAAIMQPYFFPWLGYFSLIKHADEFILFDPVQFRRHGWIERNRILKQGEGWLYIKVPLVKHPLDTAIKDVLIDESQAWRDKILAQLVVYKRLSRRYEEVSGMVRAAIAPPFTSIVDLNRHVLKVVCRYLGFERKLPVWSSMGIEIKTPAAPDEWALDTCKVLGGFAEYWNPPGGESFFDRSKYEQAGIKLRFHQQQVRPYNQRGEQFEPALSIIDVLMFNSVEEVNRMLDDYALT
jgi:hypothetical protein